MESTEKLPQRVADQDEVLARVEDAMARADEQVRRLVADHPVVTLVGAAAIGYLVGRLLAGR